MSETMETLETRGGVSQDAVKAQVYAALNWVKWRTGVYVVEQGSNSSGRWRRWSDGFLEQWFENYSKTYTAAGQTVSLPKSFTGSGYFVSVRPFSTDSFSEFEFRIASRSASSFVVAAHAYGGYAVKTGILVYAAGY